MPVRGGGVGSRIPGRRKKLSPGREKSIRPSLGRGEEGETRAGAGLWRVLVESEAEETQSGAGEETESQSGAGESEMSPCGASLEPGMGE